MHIDQIDGSDKNAEKRPGEEGAAAGTVLYVASDLIWATKIKSTGEAIGVSCRPIRNMEMLNQRLDDCPVSGVVVDLEAGAFGIDVIGQLKGERSGGEGLGGGGSGSIRVVAFGPHVARELFDQAREAGADVVLARGVFASNLPQVLLDLSAR